MSHTRKTIREAVKAALVGETSAGARVYETRLAPWKQTELPAISVYSESETTETSSRTTAPRVLERTLSLVIEAGVSLTADLDDALDAIDLQIERAMHADRYFGIETVDDSILASTEFGFAQEGNRPMGMLRKVYTFSYHTHAPEAADNAVDDLDTIQVSHSIENEVDEDDQAVDTIDVSEE